MKNPPSLKFVHKVQLFSMRLFAKGTRLLGFRFTLAVARGLGLLVWHLAKKRRLLATNNVQKHLNVSREKATQIAKKSFSEIFCSFAELLLTQNFGLDEIGKRLSIPHQKNWKDFQNCDRPLVGITGHFGSWELFSSILGGLTSADLPRTVVVRKYPNPAVHQFIMEQRETTGTSVIGHRSVAATVLKTLRQKGMVAFLVDHRPRKSEAIMLPFLGEETAVNIGPAVLSVRAEAVIWPMFLNRENDGTYSFYIYAPLDTKNLEGTNEEKIVATALFYTQAMEKHIREYPEQWFWMHDRWKKII